MRIVLGVLTIMVEAILMVMVIEVVVAMVIDNGDCNCNSSGTWVLITV